MNQHEAIRLLLEYSDHERETAELLANELRDSKCPFKRRMIRDAKIAASVAENEIKHLLT